MDSGPAPSGACEQRLSTQATRRMGPRVRADAPMANAPRLRTGANTTDHSPSLRAQRSNPASSRMPHGLLRYARNDDKPNPPPSSRTSEARCGTHNHRRSLRGSHRTASLNTSDTAYGSLLSQGRQRWQTHHVCAQERTRGTIRRHCERSEAIHLSCGCAMDCFASLAMTSNSRVSWPFAPESEIHRRRPAQAKRDAGPITTGRSL